MAQLQHMIHHAWFIKYTHILYVIRKSLLKCHIPCYSSTWRDSWKSRSVIQSCVNASTSIRILCCHPWHCCCVPARLHVGGCCGIPQTITNFKKSRQRTALWHKHQNRTCQSHMLNQRSDGIPPCSCRDWEIWGIGFQAKSSRSPHFLGYVYIYIYSTQQGGGGSFKHRKPIGEFGCCEKWMTERIHWWTERWLQCAFWSGCGGHLTRTCWM